MTKNEWKEKIARNRARGRGRKAFWVLVAAAALIVWVGPAQGCRYDRGAAQHGQHGLMSATSPEQFAERVDHVLDHLDANEDQRTRIEALVAELAPEIAGLAAEREDLRDRIATALSADELTMARIEGLQDEVGRRSARLAERAVGITLALAAELTPVQRAELLERAERR